jgi:hypothetical protein
MKNTALMTLSEYNQTVTPVLKDFYKFIKKNSKYFKKADFYGVVYHTFQEYMEYQLSRKYTYSGSQEYYENEWKKNHVVDAVPSEIYSKYLEFQEIFKTLFGISNLSKIESDEQKSNKRSVRRAIDSDLYIEYLKDGIITPDKLVEVFSSVGLKIPNNILKLKAKVETQGYNRSIENTLLAKTKEFQDVLRKELEPHYNKLKDIKKTRVMFFVDKFEKQFDQQLHKFGQSFSFEPVKNEAISLIQKLFKVDYTEGKNIYTRLSEFDCIVEKMSIQYAESFIESFIFRIEEKLLVINNKLGSPSISFSNIKFSHGELEGIVNISWTSGITITIEAQVIIAGGYHIQTEHCRYLLKPFYKGKLIDLEKIDNLNF